MMKKWILLATAVSLLAACGEEEQAPPPASQTPTEQPAAVPAPAPAPPAEPQGALPDTSPAPAAPEAPPPAPEPAPAPQQAMTHTVVPGDTLYSIAEDNGVKLEDVVAWNGIEDPSRIVVGQEIRLTAP
jgi:LysM repeat protein